MSGRILHDLGLPAPDHFLDPGKPPPGIMALRLFLGVSKHLQRHRPDLVVVVGDVTSTAAGAMAAQEGSAG